MAKILLAASSEPQQICRRILQGHELHCAKTLNEAQLLLEKDSFDLIVCTILFDDSRMFDLLRLAKTHNKWRATPFVCLRVLSKFDNLVLMESLKIATEALGANAFLDIFNYEGLPIEKASMLRAAIDTHLAASSG